MMININIINCDKYIINSIFKIKAEGYVSWKLIAEQVECAGTEEGKGVLGDVRSCAEACSGISSLFVYGTNDFGGTRCYETGCNCICETAANADGTCSRIGHAGYRLFKHQRMFTYIILLILIKRA